MMQLPACSRAIAAAACLALMVAPGAAATVHEAAHTTAPVRQAAPAPAAARPPATRSSHAAAAPPAAHHAAAARQTFAATNSARSVPVASTPTHANTQAYAASASLPGWNTGWHGDARYDWAGWRASHRALFHPGFYYPPGGGYAYAPIEVGALLAAAFLTEQYWIEDPSLYHLPPAWGPYRWVRYYNDILLVDIDTGEVVEVVSDVFW